MASMYVVDENSVANRVNVFQSGNLSLSIIQPGPIIQSSYVYLIDFRFSQDQTLWISIHTFIPITVNFVVFLHFVSATSGILILGINFLLDCNLSTSSSF